MAESIANIGLWLVYLLFIGAVAGMILFPVAYMIRNPKDAKKSLMGIGAFIVLFGICYLFSSSAVQDNYAKYDVGPAESKFIGAGLRSLYVLGIGGVILAVYSEIARYFK